MTRFLFFVAIFFSAIRISAQTESFSNDTAGVLARINRGEDLMQVQPEKSIVLYDSALAISRRLNYKTGMIKSLNSLGRLHFTYGDFNRALKEFTEALDLAVQAGNRSYEGKICNNIGNIYDQKGDYPQAMLFYTRSLKIKEELKDERGIMLSELNLATVYYNLKEYEKALGYLRQCKTKAEAQHDTTTLSLVMQNMGNNYSDMGNVKRGDSCYFVAIRFFVAVNDSMSVSGTYGNLSENFLAKHQYDSALAYAQHSADIALAWADSSLLMRAYLNMAVAHQFLGNNAEAKRYVSLALPLAEKEQELRSLSDANRVLAETNAAEGNYEAAYRFYRVYKSYSDSLINDSKSKAIAALQGDYEIQKREQQIESLNKVRVVQDRLISKQQFLNVAIGIVLALVSVLALFIYRNNRQKQKANEIISRQKEEVEKQKLLVEEKSKEIVDSINYAKRIQQAILPATNEITDAFPGSFVFYRPRDIVSGDFFWQAERGGYRFIAAADCTGHGVPGGFMSMLGTALLNEVVLEKGITEPGEILDMLRIKIILALKQKGETGENRDGMDMVLVRFSPDHRTIDFAAANNPLWLLRNGEMQEFKPDKQPVGIHSGAQQQFTQHKAALQPGDAIYLFTDGFADQFGGPKGKKFRYNQLQQTLVDLAKLPHDQRGSQLGKIFEAWKGNLEQVDDVLVIGITA